MIQATRIKKRNGENTMVAKIEFMGPHPDYATNAYKRYKVDQYNKYVWQCFNCQAVSTQPESVLRTLNVSCAQVGILLKIVRRKRRLTSQLSVAIVGVATQRAMAAALSIR